MKQRSHLWSESSTYRWSLINSSGCFGAVILGVAGGMLRKVGSAWSNVVVILFLTCFAVAWLSQGMVLLRLGTEKRLAPAERSRFRRWVFFFGPLVVPELISSIRMSRQQENEQEPNGS